MLMALRVNSEDEDFGGLTKGRQAIALLSQEGSVIAFCDDARGGSFDEILQNAFLKVNLWNHPPHDLDCCLDRAALLTQEGHSAGFNTSSVL
jgi:hypothetical protein